MPNRELLSQHSDGAKGRTEKTNQSTPDIVRMSYKSPPESPGLQPSDRARTSDVSRSRSKKFLLKMKAEFRKLRKGLKKAYQVISQLRKEVKKANQENGKLQNTVQELTNHWQQARQENEKLTHELKQARQENEKLMHELKQARQENKKLDHQLKQPCGKEETSFESIWVKALPEDMKRKWAMDELKLKKTINDLTKEHDALLRSMEKMRYKRSCPKISWWAFAYPDVYPYRYADPYGWGSANSYGWGSADPYGWGGWY